MAKPLLDAKQQRKVEVFIRCWTTKLTWEKLTEALAADLNIKISRQSLQSYLGIKKEFDNKKAELRGVSPDIVRHIKQSDVQLVERVNRLKNENAILQEACDKQLALIKRIFANASEIPNLDLNQLAKPRSDEQ